MSGEGYKSMESGPKYNTRRYPKKEYEQFLQNKEFTEYLAKNFDNSIDRIAEAITQFKVEMPDVELPELDITPLEEGLEVVNHNICLMIEEQKNTTHYIKELIGLMHHIVKMGPKK